LAEKVLQKLQADPDFRGMSHEKRKERLGEAIVILWRGQNKAKLQGNLEHRLSSIQAIKRPD
jgi:hypothetical protein